MRALIFCAIAFSFISQTVFAIDSPINNSQQGSSNALSQRLFEQAYLDCALYRGSTSESYCIKERIKNINEIGSLRPDPNFVQAYQDCALYRGSNSEAYCIRERIKNINEIKILKSDPNFTQAYQDCALYRGSNSEAYCIKERSKNINEMISIHTDPNFIKAYQDCALYRGSNSEAYCIKERIRNINEIKALSNGKIPVQNTVLPASHPVRIGGYGYSSSGSGHDAGYQWAEDHDIDDEGDCNGNSLSFNEGCEEYVEEQTEENSEEEGEDY